MWLTLRILAWRLRRPAAVLTLTALALVAASIAAPAPPPTAPVVVAARDLPAGATLGAGDLRVARAPAALVPASASEDPSTLVGRVLATALPAGLPVVTQALSGGRFTVTPPAGTAVVPLAVEDGALAPGDRVDLVAIDCPAGDPGGTLARGALVVEVTTSGAAVALAPEDARRLAAARAQCTVWPLLLA